MRPVIPLFGGVVLFALSAFGTVSTPHASAQEPIDTRTLVQQHLDGLPGGEVCWDVRQGSLAAGAASPASGYHTHTWVVAYVLGGVEYFEYEDGRSGTIEPGQAALFEQDAPHRHQSFGSEPRSNVNFELTCERQPNSFATTGPLPVTSGPVPHELQVRERVWQPGAQTPVHLLSGPTATLVLEGTIARSTASGGIQCSGPGEVYVSPVGEIAQNTAVGPAPARTLDVDLWPTGAVRSVPQPAQVRLPLPSGESACYGGK